MSLRDWFRRSTPVAEEFAGFAPPSAILDEAAQIPYQLDASPAEAARARVAGNAGIAKQAQALLTLDEVFPPEEPAWQADTLAQFEAFGETVLPVSGEERLVGNMVQDAVLGVFATALGERLVPGLELVDVGGVLSLETLRVRVSAERIDCSCLEPCPAGPVGCDRIHVGDFTGRWLWEISDSLGYTVAHGTSASHDGAVDDGCQVLAELGHLTAVSTA